MKCHKVSHVSVKKIPEGLFDGLMLVFVCLNGTRIPFDSNRLQRRSTTGGGKCERMRNWQIGLFPIRNQ